MSKDSWVNASKLLLDTSEGQQNRIVLSEVCERIAQSHLSELLDIDTSWRPNKIFIKSLDSRHGTKVLKIQAIQGDKVEICLSDSATQMERCYYPHTHSSKALDRSFEIVNNLDWGQEVKQYRNVLDRISQMFGASNIK